MQDLRRSWKNQGTGQFGCTKGKLCARKLYKNDLCKKHYLDIIREKIRRELKLTYRDPDSAYAALDFEGKGNIKIENILEGYAIKRLQYSIEDIKAFLL